MSATYSVARPSLFVADEVSLKKLSDVLKKKVGQVEITAKCSDDVTRNFSSLQQLFAFENSKAKRVSSLNISARSSDKRASIDFSGQGGTYVYVTGDASFVEKLSRDIVKILDGMRPWYSVLHKVDFTLLSLLVFAGLWILALALIAFGFVEGSEKPAQQGFKRDAIGNLVILGLTAALLAVGFFMNKVRDLVFPKSVFLIGQEKNRFRTLERVQWVVVVGFIVSVVAGLVSF